MAGEKTEQEKKARELKKIEALTTEQTALLREQNEKERAELMLMQRLGLDAKDRDELRKLRYTTGHDGKPVSYWDDMSSKATAALHSEQNAYNDYRSAMMSLLTLFSSLNHALYAEQRIILNKVITKVRELAFIPLKNALVDKFSDKSKLELPELIHSVSVGPDNKLIIPSLARADGGKFIERAIDPNGAETRESVESLKSLDDSFKKLVDLWLIDNKYVAGTKEGTYIHSETKEPLTAEAFEALKPTFDEFLADGSDLQFRSKAPTLS